MHKTPDSADTLDRLIDAWRDHMGRSRTVIASDVDELEDHLREVVEQLQTSGLAVEEAFLVAVKRMGSVDALTWEFAQEHYDRLWKQLVRGSDRPNDGSASDTAHDSRGATSLWVALGLAIAAGVAIRVPALFGLTLDNSGFFYPLHFSFFTFPFIAAYFAWARPVDTSARIGLAGAFAASALLVDLLPALRGPGEDLPVLTTLHLPVALWLVVGVAYLGGRWVGNPRRMDFLRFSGELFIYFVLIALGGLVTTAISFALFEAIGIDIEPFFEQWVLSAVMGATVIAAWLVEAKQSVIENIAPVLARIFIPILTLVLLAFLGTLVATGRLTSIERDLLFAMDLVLIVVFGLFLYSVSARDALDPPDLFDRLRLGLLAVALLVDALALWAIVARISEFGFTPNRMAALGINLVLLVNLTGATVLQARFIGRQVRVQRLWDWQTGYLYVLAAWALVVALGFPLVFGG
jgi:hypothetical protein